MPSPVPHGRPAFPRRPAGGYNVRLRDCAAWAAPRPSAIASVFSAASAKLRSLGVDHACPPRMMDTRFRSSSSAPQDTISRCPSRCCGVAAGVRPATTAVRPSTRSRRHASSQHSTAGCACRPVMSTRGQNCVGAALPATNGRLPSRACSGGLVPDLSFRAHQAAPRRYRTRGRRARRTMSFRVCRQGNAAGLAMRRGTYMVRAMVSGRQGTMVSPLCGKSENPHHRTDAGSGEVTRRAMPVHRLPGGTWQAGAGVRQGPHVEGFRQQRVAGQLVPGVRLGKQAHGASPPAEQGRRTDPAVRAGQPGR